MPKSARDRLASRLALLGRPRAPETLPARIGRRRVYILPTRFGLFFAVLLLAMTVGALNYNNNPALLLALLLGATGLASLIWTHLQLSGLVIQAVSAEPVPAGSLMLLHVAVTAVDQRTRPTLRLRCNGAHATSPPLMAGEPVVAQLELPTVQRGWLDLGRIRIATTQPLGLAQAWSWTWPDLPMLVYPVAETGGPPLPGGEGTAGSARLHPAGEELHHLRAYRAGDPRPAIAWKASARRDQLLVREFEEPLAAEIALEWRGLAALQYEHRIRRLAHWVDLAERQGRRYSMHLPMQPAIGPGQGSAHRHLCLRALALMRHVQDD